MIYTIQSTLPTWSLAGKKVFLRADLNVPLDQGRIIDDFRLTALQETLDFLIERDAIVILATHIGRPSEHDMALSTSHLVPWFAQRNYSISFEPSLYRANETIKQMKSGQILLLENLRFSTGEKQGNPEFARSLASMAEYYVNDAFASIHNTDASIIQVPIYFDKNNRTIGFLIERELKALNKLLAPQHPYTLILGGGKVREKLALLSDLLESVDTVLICPALAFSFMRSMDQDVGRSYIDTQSIGLCIDILNKAQKLGKKIILPIDYIIALNSLEKKLTTVGADSLPKSGYGISIGQKTIQLYSSIIGKSKTIFYNGLMGFNNHPESLGASKALFEAMTQSNAYTVIGGGDTVAAAHMFGLKSSMSFCSTGGGATLAYLSGKPMTSLSLLI